MIPVIDDRASGSRVTYAREFADVRQCAALEAELDVRAEHFDHGDMLVNGRPRKTPRICLAFGDDAYAFPDMGESLDWPIAIGKVRERLEVNAGHRFNYALVNRYRDGRDYTGWHADKMHMHTPGSSIAIVSLGAVRELRFRRVGERAACAAIPLDPGSLLMMHGETNTHYEHAVLADESIARPRTSLTFRFVLEPGGGACRR
jgi:alkylated DNA repair dioxygenase AlkB